MRRIAFVSFHTSPLEQPGQGDAGGLNVYVRDLASHLARSGLPCDLYTRRADPASPEVVWLEQGVRVVQVPAGPPQRVGKEAAAAFVEEFADGLMKHVEADGHSVLHSHYWLSGLAALDVADRAGLPLVHTAHTLSLLRALPDGGDARVAAEQLLCSEADLMVANTPHEAEALADLYGAPADRVEVIPPGVDHTLFRPGEQAAARARLGISDADLVAVFVGRVQRLKGADLAVEAMLELSRTAPELARRVTLVVAGGASGPDGAATLELMRSLAAHPEMLARVELQPPRPHPDIVDLYHAADVCLVPSRSESFGLVALEAQACGIPVVATAVDGLPHVVPDGLGGVLVQPEAGAIAWAVQRVLGAPCLRARLSAAARVNAGSFSWGLAAARHRLSYGALLSPDGVAVCG